MCSINEYSTRVCKVYCNQCGENQADIYYSGRFECERYDEEQTSI